MERPMLIPLLLFAWPLTPGHADIPTQKDPPIRVWLNDDGKYIYGDRAKVYVKSAEDGHLVVLRSDAQGNVKVLWPVDVEDDQQIHGGKKYEVKGRGGREAFVAEDTTGQGVVLAAWSKTPFDFRPYERDGQWDLQALADATGRQSASAGDPETRLRIVVDSMKGGGQYEYDAVTYVLYSPRLARVGYYPYPYAWGGWWGYDPWSGYSPWWGYRPWWGGPYFGARAVIVPRVSGFRRW
jgi:hypothetical protein